MQAPDSEKLEAQGIRFVRFTWCDNAGVTRAKSIHVKSLGEGIGVTLAAQGFSGLADAPSPGSGLSAVGDMQLSPDWTTLTPLSYAPGQARVMVFLAEGGEESPLCPRSFLARQLGSAQAAGIRLRLAVELEFYLVQADITPAGPPEAHLDFEQNHILISEITNLLEAQQIQVQYYYPGSGPGQHKIGLAPSQPMTLADHILAARETIRLVAHRQGLRATFLPKPFPDLPGNGAPLQVYLDCQNSPEGAYGISAGQASFMSGVLAHLPALTLLTTPSPNSYARLSGHEWAGAYRIWGFDNHQAALRVPKQAAGSWFFEFKSHDATANPYLALGAVIAAGLDGQKRQLTLPEPSQFDPSQLSPLARRIRGVPVLPSDFPESKEHFELDPLLPAALGPRLARAAMAVREAEWEALGKAGIIEQALKLFERY